MKPTDEQKATYLTHIEATGRVMESLRKAGLSYRQLESALRADKEFDEDVGAARRAHGEHWEKATFERGITGWLEPRFNKDGEEVGHVRKYSDRCLELGLKRNCPEYREKMQIDARVTGGVLVVGGTMTKDEWFATYGGAKTDV